MASINTIFTSTSKDASPMFEKDTGSFNIARAILDSNTLSVSVCGMATAQGEVGRPVGKFSSLSRAFSIKSSVTRSEEHTSELQSRGQLVCRLLLEKKQ